MFFQHSSFFTSYFYKALLLIITVLISMDSYAVSISAQRIYLDQNKANERFVIVNKEQNIQECKLGLTHFYYNESGSLFEYENDEIPENSANKLLRYSPKYFDIQANSRQTIRFAMRRKSDSLAKEYRSYLVVTCDDKIKEINSERNEDDVVKISMSPLLVHNVPIIVRPKKITNTKVNIQNITFNEGSLNFDILREGDRSVYGTVQVIDKNNDEVIVESGKFSLYTETFKKNLILRVNTNIPISRWLLRFVEDKHYGGTIVAESSVK